MPDEPPGGSRWLTATSLIIESLRLDRPTSGIFDTENRISAAEPSREACWQRNLKNIRARIGGNQRIALRPASPGCTAYDVWALRYHVVKRGVTGSRGGTRARRTYQRPRLEDGGQESGRKAHCRGLIPTATRGVSDRKRGYSITHQEEGNNAMEEGRPANQVHRYPTPSASEETDPGPTPDGEEVSETGARAETQIGDDDGDNTWRNVDAPVGQETNSRRGYSSPFQRVLRSVQAKSALGLCVATPARAFASPIPLVTVIEQPVPCAARCRAHIPDSAEVEGRRGGHHPGAGYGSCVMVRSSKVLVGRRCKSRWARRRGAEDSWDMSSTSSRSTHELGGAGRARLLRWIRAPAKISFEGRSSLRKGAPKRATPPLCKGPQRWVIL
ncbi:hypothetical protein C8R45DRAFT_1164320 [Mycena sanguinolenta]|nr:hypothetical protein C8R45DRAFT_1164320 [Mycena sanguinolenta]